MQRQRYWVERCFEDGKGQCGMADYQVRLWNAWHHHMAMVMMAMTISGYSEAMSEDSAPWEAAMYAVISLVMLGLSSTIRPALRGLGLVALLSFAFTLGN
jgi:hypothetical protein